MNIGKWSCSSWSSGCLLFDVEAADFSCPGFNCMSYLSQTEITWVTRSVLHLEKSDHISYLHQASLAWEDSHLGCLAVLRVPSLPWEGSDHSFSMIQGFSTFQNIIHDSTEDNYSGSQSCWFLKTLQLVEFPLSARFSLVLHFFYTAPLGLKLA